MGLSIEEQEIHISASRDEDFATAYCSDSTWITKMDKLVTKSPELFEVIAENALARHISFLNVCLVFVAPLFSANTQMSSVKPWLIG